MKLSIDLAERISGCKSYIEAYRLVYDIRIDDFARIRNGQHPIIKDDEVAAILREFGKVLRIAARTKMKKVTK